jgi:hypothetical protein
MREFQFFESIIEKQIYEQNNIIFNKLYIQHIAMKHVATHNQYSAYK